MDDIIIRRLQRDEVKNVWQIERREIVEDVYYVKDGDLYLRSEFYDTRDWPDGEPELYTPVLLDCFDHGGVFLGAFNDEKLVAAGVVDARPVIDYPDLRQLPFLHVSHDWRGKKLASKLYGLCKEIALEQGAKGFYISATSTRRTVDFYMHQGGVLTTKPDKKLYEMEPDDIHLIHYFLS
ncbi:GNAT family N-acetyltransferase [Paenochrobactrum sp. BZR 588]|uniref:GNAT family N-acetyltransferase n=1 Tax=unclassified Paenochrobactrum TaxID=2639760 RepID=UPI00385462AB